MIRQLSDASLLCRCNCFPWIPGRVIRVINKRVSVARNPFKNTLSALQELLAIHLPITTSFSTSKEVMQSRSYSRGASLWQSD